MKVRYSKANAALE